MFRAINRKPEAEKSAENTIAVSVYSDTGEAVPVRVAVVESARNDGLVRIVDCDEITSTENTFMMPPDVAKRLALALLTAAEWNGGERNGR